MVRIGIVGLGIIAQNHLDAIETNKDCILCAAADVNEEKARGIGEKYNVEYFLDYKDMLSAKPDAVILNLPHFLHCEASCFFLEHGISVLVEKPMANTPEECQKMIQAANGKARLAVGHIQRFFGANEIVRGFYKNETFGKLCMTNERRNIFYFADNRPRWFLSKKTAGGGIVMNYGAHALDKLCYIIGDEIEEVHSNYGNLLNSYDIEGHAQFYLKFKNGISSAVTFSGYHGFEVDETTYYFTDAAVRVSGNNVEIAKNGKFEPYKFCEEHAPFEKQLIEFLKYIDGKQSCIATGEYASKIITIIDKIYN